MQVLVVTAAMMILGHITYALRNDAKIREAEYTLPLATMPENAENLAKEMIEATLEGTNFTEEQVTQIQAEIFKMLGEGAVLQRNHELAKTREVISYYGQFLSWFMKAKGLNYAQIQAKYEQEFKGREVELHKSIIVSASRVNADLLGKLVTTLKKKLMPMSAL